MSDGERGPESLANAPVVTASRLSALDPKARVLAAVAGKRSLVRADLRREVGVVGLSSVVVGGGLFFAFHGVAHAAGRPTWLLLASLGAWAMTATVAMRTAWRHGVRPASGSIVPLAAVALGAPALLYAMHRAFVCLAPAVARLHAERVGFKCLGLTLAAALVPLVGLAWVRRGSDPMHPVASGTALGVASGVCAGSMVVVWCPVVALTHVLVGHVLPLVVSAAAGALLGARVIAMRPGQYEPE